MLFTLFFLSVVHKAVLSVGVHTAPTPLSLKSGPQERQKLFLTVNQGTNVYQTQSCSFGTKNFPTVTE